MPKQKKIKITKSSTAEEVRRRAREKRKPKPKLKPKPKPKPKSVVTGKAGMVASIKDPVYKLRGNRKSKLYTMEPAKFRTWFKKKHGVAYPYNVPKKKI